MPDIEEYLSVIENGVYGKDVRAAIVNAIRQCYADGKAGATDETARADIAMIKGQIGTSNIGAIDSDATDLTKALLCLKKQQSYQVGETVRISIHDWFPGYFSNGAVSFYIPLSRPADRKTIGSENAKYVTAVFDAYHGGNLRAVGVNGWKTISQTSLTFRSAVVTFNRSALWVTLDCATALQPVTQTCLISAEMTFTLVEPSS